MLKFIDMHCFRAILLATLLFAVGIPDTSAATKKTESPKAAAPETKGPSTGDSSLELYLYMKDAKGNKAILTTQLWTEYPDYDADVIKRFFAVMQALEKEYGFKKDNSVATTWSTKENVAKCSIYLEATDPSYFKKGTGTIVGCENNGVSSLAVTTSDKKPSASHSTDARHVSDTLALFKKDFERAKESVRK